GCWGHEVDEVYRGNGGKAARGKEGATVHRGRAPAWRCCTTSAQDAAVMDLNRHLRPARGCTFRFEAGFFRLPEHHPPRPGEDSAGLQGLVQALSQVPRTGSSRLLDLFDE